MVIFQSTLSVRRATRHVAKRIVFHAFQSTLSVRRATSLLASRKSARSKFQSTLSVRRATHETFRAGRRIGISIHALREESDTSRLVVGCDNRISIHALREESDGIREVSTPSGTQFQSTLSVRRATGCFFHWFLLILISIHALREESDKCRSSACLERPYFNPRSP